MPFEKVLHKVTTLDPQPTSASVASMVVLVTGQLVVSSTSYDRSTQIASIVSLQVDDSANAIHFSQIFHLIPEAGSYYVYEPICLFDPCLNPLLHLPFLPL